MPGFFPALFVVYNRPYFNESQTVKTIWDRQRNIPRFCNLRGFLFLNAGPINYPMSSLDPLLVTNFGDTFLSGFLDPGSQIGITVFLWHKNSKKFENYEVGLLPYQKVYDVFMVFLPHLQLTYGFAIDQKTLILPRPCEQNNRNGQLCRAYRCEGGETQSCN